MKKLLALLCVAVTIFTFAACEPVENTSAGSDKYSFNYFRDYTSSFDEVFDAFADPSTALVFSKYQNPALSASVLYGITEETVVRKSVDDVPQFKYVLAFNKGAMTSAKRQDWNGSDWEATSATTYQTPGFNDNGLVTSRTGTGALSGSYNYTYTYDSEFNLTGFVETEQADSTQITTTTVTYEGDYVKETRAVKNGVHIESWNYTFNDDGKPSKMEIENGAGNEVVDTMLFEYNDEGYVKKATHEDSGDYEEYTWSNGLLKTVTYSDGTSFSEVEYTYEDGILVGIEYDDSIETYTYK